jgi:hypothetical protein
MPSFPSFSKKRGNATGYHQEKTLPMLQSPGAAVESQEGLEENFNTFSEKVDRRDRRHTVQKYIFGAGVAGAAAGFLVMGPVGLFVGGGLATAAGARAGARNFKKLFRRPNKDAFPEGKSSGKISLRRARLLERWARLQMNDLDDRQHRIADKGRVLDYVISEFAPWAEILSSGDGNGREQEDAAVHLRPLIRLLSAPGVAEVLAQANALWASEWQDTSGTMSHNSSRVFTVLPTLVVLPDACTISVSSPKGNQCLQLPSSDKSLQPSPLLLELARWSVDFLEAHDVEPSADIESKSSDLFHSLPSIPSTPERGPILSTPTIGNVEREVQHHAGAMVVDLPDGCDVPPLGAEDDHSDCDHSDSEEIQSVVTAASRFTSRSGLLPAPQGELQFAGLVRSQAVDADHSYDEPDATELQVRGPTYLTDGLKVASAHSLTSFVALDLLRSTGSQELPWHASEGPDSAVAQLRAQGEKRFLFVIHFRLTPLQFVVVFALPAKPPDTAGSKLLQDFIENFSDEERASRFKVIPRVPEGPFLARKAVPEKPAILGKKLDCRFFHEPGDHFEISVDVFSSFAVQYACSQVLSAAKKITMDLGFLIEAKEASELPEVVLGTFRARRIDVGRARPLSVNL